MAKFTQDTRRMAVDTPFGWNVLLLRSFGGREDLSQLFSYELDMLSERESLPAAEIVGEGVTFWIDYPDGQHRYFHGIVNRFAFLGTGDRASIYRASVVPKLWLLTQGSDCRVFQEMTLPDIIKKILDEKGIPYDARITGFHPQHRYRVQYRETHYNFVARLMEEEGIFYFFKHDRGKHTLVLADDRSGYEPCRDKEVMFAAKLSQSGPIEDQLSTADNRAIANVEYTPDDLQQWEHQQEIHTGLWTHRDYNFETPNLDLFAETASRVHFDSNQRYEHYDYPGVFRKKPEAEAEIKLRMQEIEADCEVVSGEGCCRSFGPGGTFCLKKHHASGESGKSYVVTSVRHSGTVGSSYVSGDVSLGGSYGNQFTCIPDSVVFRPTRTTPKPTIQGVQTAVVTGPKGEEIYTDEYGRIKVQFHWDREGKFDENSSCWIRCAQLMAGKKWGAMCIPRINQEVMVAFEEGDPDRPLVAGLVYNAEQLPHYGLPDEKTKTYFKTCSSKGGAGFNELRIEDLKGEEQIFVHAQRDMDVRVLRDSKEIILRNRHQIIGKGEEGNQTELVYRDKQLNIKRHHIEHIEGNMQLLIGKGGGQGGLLDVVVEKDRKDLVEGSQHVTVKGDRKEKVDGTQSLTTRSHQEQVTGDYALEAQNIHLKAGMNVVIEAGMKVSLVVGGNFVDVSPAGVAINGVVVLINSGGAPALGLGAHPQAPQAPQQAAPEKPEEADDDTSGDVSAPVQKERKGPPAR